MSSLDPPRPVVSPPVTPPSAVPLPDLPLADLPSDPAERLTLCMQHLHRLVSHRFIGSLLNSLHGEDVSLSQMTAMYKVRAFAPISVTALAEHLGVSLPGTSQLIQELVRRDLMERRENPDNRREKLLALSEQGQQFLSFRERAMVEAYTEVFGGVDPGTLARAEQTLTDLILQARQLQPTSHSPTSPPPPPLALKENL
ncbi:MarR family winged helix-turn-helix transcriptional regulator [Deinococcus sp.]|uniref:MarR family winged helix-turn-helix transcriptional regulator n=1 Tax=Deinococcus sp. TaxID=47478 RepID=UPI003CC65107